MKFTLPTLVALFTALPAFAYELPKAPFFELSQDLTIEIVTPWSDANTKGEAGVTGDEVKVDDHMYHRLDSFLLEKGNTGAGASFPLWRESWANHYLGVSIPRTVALLWADVKQCGVQVMDDLDIPILHILYDDIGKPRANQHEDKVVVMCDELPR
jgi:hypothetical protein